MSRIYQLKYHDGSEQKSVGINFDEVASVSLTGLYHCRVKFVDPTKKPIDIYVEHKKDPNSVAVASLLHMFATRQVGQNKNEKQI